MTDRLHLRGVCADAWVPGGEHFCDDCKPVQPVRTPIPFPGSLPGLTPDLGATE